MHKYFPRIAVGLVIVAMFSLAFYSWRNLSPSKPRLTVHSGQASSSTRYAVDPPVDSLTDIAQLATYVDAVKKSQAAEYDALVQQAAAEQARIDAEAQQVRSSQSQMPAAPMSPSRVGGAHSDLWWQGVAMCEQGGQNSPYFGYFSFMDGSQGGRPWADQVAAGNELLSRYPERESQGGAWADSCVDMGYQYSPGG